MTDDQIQAAGGDVHVDDILVYDVNQAPVLHMPLAGVRKVRGVAGDAEFCPFPTLKNHKMKDHLTIAGEADKVIAF